MNNQIFISDIEAISPLGNILDEIVDNLVSNNVTLNNKVNHICDFNFYKQGYGVKTRIDTSGKLCVHVTAQLASRDKETQSNRLGLITVSKYGCLESRDSYLNQLQTLEDKQYASPRDFVQSICNIPNALATIESKIHGFGNHLVGSGDATVSALWQGAKCLDENIVDKMIITTFQVITDKQVKTLEESGLHYECISDLASGLKLQTLRENSHDKMLFQILGFGFASNSCIEQAVEQAVERAVSDSKINVSDVQFVVSSANTQEAFDRYEAKGIRSRISESVPVIMFKRYLGESFAAFPILALAILSRISENTELTKLLSVDKDASLSYNNDVFGKNSVFMLVTYDYTGSASVVCLKRC